MRIAILGGGVSGLALGHYLRDDPRIEFTIFEAAAMPGGLCRSKSVDGFVYDLAGGHILFSKDPEILALQQSLCEFRGGTHRKDRRTAIRWEDRFVRYPFENGIGDLPPTERYECLVDYLRAAQARENGAGAPRDFRSWIHWRFGDGIARHFMQPYNEKIWCYDLAELSASWVAGRVPDAPVEDVIRAACQVETVGYAHQAIFYYPLHGGFQTITDGLAREAGDRLRTSTPIEKIEAPADLRPGHGEYRVNGETFDLVVNTIPLPELVQVLPALSDEGRRAIAGLRWLGLSSILIALDRPALEERSWIYLPFSSQGPANRVTYFSNYSPNNAPSGKSSFLAEVTWPRETPPRADENFCNEVLEGLAIAGLLDRREVLFTDVATQRYAYIVFDLSFEENIRTAVSAVEGLGIETFGRFGRFEYLNSDMCISRARDMAARIRGRLER